MTHTEMVGVTARKPHVCTYCSEAIPAGEKYWRWATFDDEGCFQNKMHAECLDDASDHAVGGGSFEYEPFHQERPLVRPTVNPGASRT